MEVVWASIFEVAWFWWREWAACPATVHSSGKPGIMRHRIVTDGVSASKPPDRPERTEPRDLLR